MKEGTIHQIIGPVIDVKFEEGHMPALLNAIEIPAGERTVLAEVAQHVGDDVAKCIALESTDGLCRGLRSFGRRIVGYDVPDAVLTAAETRTSAPLRILRTPEGLTAIGQDRVYPAGEGAGYAGGITSAAVDGVRVAMALMALRTSSLS